MRETARLAVFLTAFAPMAFFFSAVYSESLYLALSVGLFWCARQGRWALVGVVGALAAATRSTGIVLIVPALMLYLYGPREDRAEEALARARSGWRRLRPRYRLELDALWLLLPALGVVLYLGYLGLSGGDALAPFDAQQVWGRHFAGPYVGIWDGLRAAFEGLRQLLSGPGAHVYFTAGVGSANVRPATTCSCSPSWWRPCRRRWARCGCFRPRTGSMSSSPWPCRSPIPSPHSR